MIHMYLRLGQSSHIWCNIHVYRVGHEKVAPLPFCTCPCYCINFCIYALLRTRATFSWPNLCIYIYIYIYMYGMRYSKYVVAHPVCMYIYIYIGCATANMSWPTLCIYIYIYIYIGCAIANMSFSNNNKYKYSQQISATRIPFLNSTFQVRTNRSSSCMKNYFGNQYQWNYVGDGIDCL